MFDCSDNKSCVHQQTSSAAADNQEDAEHEIFKDREVDAFDIETVTLGLDHVQLGSDSVPYISSGDAWNIATDPSWSEPSGTRRGNWGADAIPFRRTLNAFNQYLKSRSLALTKAHQVFVHAFREHTDLVSTRDGLHMNSGWNPPAGRTTIHKENESCWFLRDMQGCLNVWWKSMLERPGQGWSKVPALDSIRESFDCALSKITSANTNAKTTGIIRGFLNYLQNFDIYPEATEPFLHNSLEQACKAAESAYDQMFSATAVYASTWDQHNGWSGLGRKIWCPEVEDEEDIDKQTPVRMDWNQIPTLQMEENEASKENGNLAGQADEARAEDEEEKQKTVKVMEGWHETADKGEKLLIDAAPAEAGESAITIYGVSFTPAHTRFFIATWQHSSNASRRSNRSKGGSLWLYCKAQIQTYEAPYCWSHPSISRIQGPFRSRSPSGRHLSRRVLPARTCG